MRAYCFRCGTIEFGRKIPDGALPLIQGPKKAIESRVLARARHAYDGKTLLVPGIPEAIDDDAALSSYQSFVALLSTPPIDAAQTASKAA